MILVLITSIPSFGVYNLIEVKLRLSKKIKINSFGVHLYYDSYHLTLTGSEQLSELFKIIINDSELYEKQQH